MKFDRAVDKFSLQPEKLFIVDALGAILSAFLLGFVLVQLENIFGIPKSTLYFLAFLPVLFAAYDFYCYRNIKNDIGEYLNIIAVVNLIYCCISLGLAIYHYQVITIIGWTYIIFEIMIVVVLATLELKTANKLMTNK